MELRTKVIAEVNKQDILITREFDLPVELLFKAYTEAEFLEQWMGTKVEKLNNEKYGSYIFKTINPQGSMYTFTGTIHNIESNARIIRTFEFVNMGFGVQLEVLEFAKLTNTTSKLIMQSIYQSVEYRSQALKLPFAYGINMAHNKLQEILNKLI
jgi:uncharacterized protein YndB with AHSA1/START domain